MPPQQCPDCGRFLKNDLVASLTDTPTPCPGCDTGLVAAMFADSGAARGDASSSVRPPDLAPESVRDDPAQALAGWDAGEVADLERWRDDRPPFPVDAAVIGGAALVGALVGAVSSRRAVRGATLGGLAAGLGAAAARQIWRLEE